MSRRPPGLALLALALVAAAALYAPTLTRGLVDFDDPWLVEANDVVQHASARSLHTIFFDLDSPARFMLGAEYLPTRDLSMMADFAIWGDWYPGFHVTNLIIYLAAIALWFAALDGFGIDRTVVGVAMLLWALHPTHAESVAWITERKGLLGAMLAGAAVLGYARFRAGARTWWLVLATLAAVLAVWSKAQAAFGVAAIVALELALPARRVSWRRSVVGLGAIAIAGLAAFVPVVVLASRQALVGFAPYAGGNRVATVLGVHGFYLELAAMTRANAIAYPISTDGPSAIELVVGALGLVGALAVAFVPARRSWAPSPVLRAAAGMWLVMWFPVSHLVVALERIMVADRYLLLPSLGLALAAAVGLLAIPRPRARTALIATIAVAAALRTFAAQANWASPLALWERAVESSPDDADAWSFYAEALAQVGRSDLALAATEQGLARQPNSGRLLLRRAILELGTGDRATAEVTMSRAADAGEPRAMANLALLLLDDGRLDDAVRWGQRAAASAHESAHIQQSWGKVALAAHRDADALAAFTLASALEPASAAHHYNIALALLALHRPAEALPQLEAAAGDPALATAVDGARAEAHRQLDRSHEHDGDH